MIVPPYRATLDKLEILVKIQLDVTEKDIQTGKPGCPARCPIARTLRRLFPKAFSVYVKPYNDIQSGTSWTATVSAMKYSLSIELSQEIGEKLDHYDLTGELTPFSFEIEF